MLASCIDKKADCPGHQSGIPEMGGGQVLPELEDEWLGHEMYDASVFPTKPQPRRSPELHHPINSDPDRESLYQRRRGTPASHHRSSADPCRGDRPLVGATQSATSSSSRRQSKPHGSLHSGPNGGNGIPSSNAYTLQSDASAPYQPSAHPLSHEVSPEEPAPTTNYPLTDATFPSSPKAALASPPSDVLSPVSPMVEEVHPPLNIAFSATLSDEGSSPGTSERQIYPLDSLDSNIQSRLDIHDSMELSAPIASQTENNMSQLSPPVVQNRYQSKNWDVHSVSTQPHHLRMHSSDLEGFGPSNGSKEITEADVSPSMTQSIMTRVNTPRAEDPGFSPTAFSSTSPSQNSRTLPGSQSDIDVQFPPDATGPSTAFRILPVSRSLNRQTGTVTRPVMEMCDFDNSDATSHTLEQSELQPWSPLDHLIATNTFDLLSTGPQFYSNDYCPQAVPQQHSSDFSFSHTRFVKWRPYCFDHNSSLVSHLAPKQKQVEGLQRLICTINHEWMQRMESQPGLWPLCSTLSPSNLFDRAIRTLKKFICGDLLEGFEDAFAIITMAFAAAWSLTWQQHDYLFSALRDDALQWQHALRRDEDKARLLDAMNCWRLDELEPPPLFASACHTNSRGLKPQEPLYCGDQHELRDRLKEDEVLKAIMAFLDSMSIRSLFKT